MTTMIVWFWGYLVPWISGFFIFGIFLMMADMYLVKIEDKKWIPSYRKWYNRTRPPEDALPNGVMGWLYGHPWTRWHHRALLISGIQSFVSIIGGANAAFEFVAFLVEGWVIIPGLWIGKYAFNLLWKQEEYLQRADEIRDKVINSGVAGISSAIGSAISKSVSQAASHMTSSATTTPATPAEPKVVPKSEGMSAAEILRRRDEGRKI